MSLEDPLHGLPHGVKESILVLLDSRHNTVHTPLKQTMRHHVYRQTQREGERKWKGGGERRGGDRDRQRMYDMKLLLITLLTCRGIHWKLEDEDTHMHACLLFTHAYTHTYT